MPQFSPALAVVGPTATGKTQLALALAQWWLTESAAATNLTGVDLISADSRQIYQGLETISGADIPADFQPVTLTPTEWENFDSRDQSVKIALSQNYQKKLGAKDISLWGVASLPVSQSWSAGQFQVFGQLIAHRAQQLHRAVIVVGGTGLYQQILWQKDWQISVPPDPTLRTAAATATVTELQTWLKEKAPERLSGLNQSDLNNPRRLIRHLELADQPDETTATSNNQPAIFTIGLTRDLTDLPALITARVQARWHQNAQAEATALDPTTTQPTVLTTLGVKELRLLADDQLTADQAQTLWAQREWQYAKRQLTWWKKRLGIHWFSATQPDLLTAVTHLIEASQPTLPELY